MNRNFLSVTATLLALALSACGTNPAGSDSQRNKRIADANVQLGVAYMRDGDYDTAMKKLQRALEAEPDSATANGTIAVLYETIGENALAEKHFKTALRTSPDDPQTHNNYGQYLCRHGQYGPAIEQFKRAAADPLYPGIAATLTNAGICAGHIPDDKQAEEYLRKALEHDPNFAYALLQMAALMHKQDNNLAARAYIQRYDGVSAPSAEGLWLGFQIENSMGDSSAAAGYALKLKNAFPAAKETASLVEWEHEHRGQQ
jgi:type IV pilus assembly protein PilF